MSGEIVGLVLSGGGARGAYEVGALSVLLRRLAARGQAPTRFVGTSAGALNVVGVAGFLEGDDWAAATQRMAELWTQVRLPDVADVPRSVGEDVASFLAQLVNVDDPMWSLLDTTPLRETLTDQLPLEAMHENVRSGRIEAVAVAATSASTDRTVVFVEAHPDVPTPPYDPVRNIEYVRTTLTVDHVLASAAVSVAFRPIKVADDWYVDGGVQLNTPLKPALKLGCQRLVVIATHPSTWPDGRTRQPEPDVYRAASLVLRTMLVDHLVEDLRKLVKVNAALPPAGAGRHQRVQVQFVGPPASEAHAIAELAQRVRPGVLTDRDLWVLEHLIGGPGGERGELLSFLMFHPAFARALIELGARHAEPAQRWRATSL